MIKNQAIGGRSNRGLILLGLFLGIVSAVLVVVYLSQASEDGGGDVSSAVVTPVVVAAQDIAAGTRVTEEMVELRELSAGAILAGVFGDTADVIGQVTRVPLVAGEQFIATKVTPTGAAITNVDNPPLAYVIPDGKRAISIQVSSIIGVSGLIRPGDYVDVILSIKLEGEQPLGDGTTDRTSDQIAVTILQNAQVLSIDQDVALTAVGDGTEGAPSISDEGDGANPEATTVTLAVSPVHSEVLTVAEICGQNFSGRLALALRAFGDSTPVETRSVWADNGAPPTCAALLGLSSLQ